MPNNLGEIWGKLEQRLGDIDAAVQKIGDVDANVRHCLNRLSRVEERLSEVEKTSLDGAQATRDTADAVIALSAQINQLQESVSGQVRHEVEKGLDATRSVLQLVDAAKIAGQ